MTNPFSDSTNDDVLFPDDLPGQKLDPLSEEPVPADDVPHDDAKYGHYTLCESASDGEVWVNSQKQLRAILGEHYDDLVQTEGFPVIEIHDADRGDAEHDPWQFDFSLVEEGDPL